VSKIHVVVLSLSYTEGAHKELVRAFLTYEEAIVSADMLNAIVRKADQCCELVEASTEEWVQQHPHPTDAYETYTRAKADYISAAHDKMWECKTLPRGSFEDFEARSAELDRLEKLWEESHKHLHWSVVKENWRLALIAHRDSLHEHTLFLAAIAPLEEKFPACKGYAPAHISFHVEACPIGEERGPEPVITHIGNCMMLR